MDALITDASVGRITGPRKAVFNDSHWDFIDPRGFICQPHSQGPLLLGPSGERERLPGLVTCLLNFSRWETNDWREGWNGKLFVTNVPRWESESVANASVLVKSKMLWWSGVKCQVETSHKRQKRFMCHWVQAGAVCVNRSETLRIGRICLEKGIMLCLQRRR